MHHLHQPRHGFPLFLGTTRRYLVLSSNAISGTIPKQLSTLTPLNALLLDDNKLTGNIPTQFTKLASLGAFAVNRNALSKAIPTTLGAWGANVR
jgi:receptor kinase-like protein